MSNNTTKQILKQLAVDVLMLLVFLALVGFSVWLIYIYFFRGPIDIETRGFVSRTILVEVVQPIQVEKYMINHFHNLDDVVLAGIQSESLCVECHGDYPHKKDKKTRSFFNAHSWFIACEVCHITPEKEEMLSYRWLESDTGKALTSLNGQPGVYGKGLIIPLRTENGTEKRLDILSEDDQVYTEEFINQRENLDDKEIERAKKIVIAFDKAEKQGLGVVSLGSKMIDPPVVKRQRFRYPQSDALLLLGIVRSDILLGRLQQIAPFRGQAVPRAPASNRRVNSRASASTVVISSTRAVVSISWKNPEC